MTRYFLLLALLACTPDAGVVTATGRVVFENDPVDLGTAFVGGVARSTVRVQNRGRVGGELHLTATPPFDAIAEFQVLARLGASDGSLEVTTRQG